MRWVIVMLVALAGCPATPPGDDVPDAPPAETALHVGWESVPASIPADVSDTITLERVEFDIANLRIVGDTGAIDYPTAVEWRDAQRAPQLDFVDPPAGLYARVVFDVLGADGDDDGAELRGTVETSDGREDFKLELGDVTVSVDVALRLEPGDDRTQTIRVDFGALLEAVDFEALPVVDGKRELEEDDPQAEALRDQLERSFSDGGVTTPG